VFHMTESGPKPCRAKPGNCPIGGEHFENKADGIKAYELALSGTSAPQKTSKRKGIYSHMKRVSYEGLLRPETKTLVLSDVDGTLLRGSLVLDHAVMLHEKGVIDLGDLPTKWLADQKNEDHIMQLADGYRKAISGMKESELQIPAFIESVVNNPDKLYSSLERLKRHRAAGHDVILISGSPSFLVGPFAKTFGFEVIATRYHRDRSRRLNGKITGMFGAPQKEAVVDKMDLSTYDKIIGYGDTSSDVPLLQRAHHSVLVEPNEETLRKIGDLKVTEILHK